MSMQTSASVSYSMLSTAGTIASTWFVAGAGWPRHRFDSSQHPLRRSEHLVLLLLNRLVCEVNTTSAHFRRTRRQHIPAPVGPTSGFLTGGQSIPLVFMSAPYKMMDRGAKCEVTGQRWNDAAVKHSVPHPGRVTCNVTKPPHCLLRHHLRIVRQKFNESWYGTSINHCLCLL